MLSYNIITVSKLRSLSDITIRLISYFLQFIPMVEPNIELCAFINKYA